MTYWRGIDFSQVLNFQILRVANFFSHSHNLFDKTCVFLFFTEIKHKYKHCLVRTIYYYFYFFYCKCHIVFLHYLFFMLFVTTIEPPPPQKKKKIYIFFSSISWFSVDKVTFSLNDSPILPLTGSTLRER